MLVFKFGGASVKDANGIINLGTVVKKFEGEQLLIVVSAMGKTTNALERLTKAYVNGGDDLQSIFDEVKTYHYTIMEALFEPYHPVFQIKPLLRRMQIAELNPRSAPRLLFG